MTTYNTYQEAKIANPDSEIVTTAPGWAGDKRHVGKFELISEDYLKGAHELGDESWVICNPSDHCMTVDKFLADGHKFSDGDVVVNREGLVKRPLGDIVRLMNIPSKYDVDSFILRAAALEEKEPELTKDDSPQGVISAISNRLHNIGCEHQDSALGEELGSMACDIWGVLPMISNEPIEEKKPRTKVKYEKWNFECAWHAIKAFEDGERIYTKRSHKDYILIDNAPDVLRFLYDLHERIETPITWQDELYEYLDNSCEMNDNFDDSFTIEIDDRPLSFNLSDDEFVDMCKFVASLNSVN